MGPEKWYRTLKSGVLKGGGQEGLGGRRVGGKKGGGPEGRGPRTCKREGWGAPNQEKWDLKGGSQARGSEGRGPKHFALLFLVGFCCGATSIPLREGKIMKMMEKLGSDGGRLSRGGRFSGGRSSGGRSNETESVSSRTSAVASSKGRSKAGLPVAAGSVSVPVSRTGMCKRKTTLSKTTLLLQRIPSRA